MSYMVLKIIHVPMIPQIILASVLIPSFCKLLGIFQICYTQQITKTHDYRVFLQLCIELTSCFSFPQLIKSQGKNTFLPLMV